MHWPRLFKARSVRFLLPTLAVVVTGALIALPSGLAKLSNSDFDAGDGNLVLDDNGDATNDDVKDWQNVGVNCTSNPKVGCALDLQRSQQDDSFGQGTAENDPVPTRTDGSIPNNKSDLTRFYVAGESASNNNTLLYLGWERVQEPTGTTNLDFELNKKGCNTPDPDDVEDCSTNGVTPDRSPGDVLIKYDLAQGGTTVALGFHRWVTTGTDSSLCEQSSEKGGGGTKPPCWSPEQSFANNGEASINTASVTDPINPNAPRALDPRTFGEAAVDLTGAGIVAPGDCAPFASAYLKSRSSDSFSSAIKDFVAPVPLNIDVCGSIKVKKTDDAGNALGGVTFKLLKDIAPTGPPDGDGTGNPNQDAPGVEDTQVDSCTTGDGTGGTTLGECTFEDVLPGKYWVVEDTTSVPPNYTPSAGPKHVSVGNGQNVDITSTPFVNPRKHKVIVLVCHQGTNTLANSDVTNGSNTKTSLAKGVTLPDGVSEAELCGLGGASFGDKAHQDDDRYDVDIGRVGGSDYSPHE